MRGPKRRAPTAQQIGAAGERLLEKPLLLERLAEDDPQHAAMARIGHRLDTGAPPIDESLRIPGVFLLHAARCRSA